MENLNEITPKEFDQEKLSRKGHHLFLFIQVIGLIICVPAFLYIGDYGWTLFTVIPASIGLTIGTYTKGFQNGSFLRGFGITLSIIFVLSTLLLVCGFEGAICILMALGLIAIPALLGMCVGYFIRKAHRIGILVFIFILNSSSYVYDRNDESKIISTASESIVINTSREKVWNVLTHPVYFSLNTNLFFKAGVSFPLSMKIEKNDLKECFLCCNFNNGYTKLKIERFDTLKSIRFSFTDHVIPMKELTFYQSIDAPHLNEGYFIPAYGEFELESISSNQCRIIARTAYSYKITPAFYWRWWADYLVNRMHQNVLNDLKKISEKENK